MSEQAQTFRSVIPLLFGVAVFMGAIIFTAIAKKTGQLDYDTANRVAGTILGLALMVVGNFLPKITRRLTSRLQNSVKPAKTERQVGQILVLAGLVSAALWIIAPIDLDYIKLLSSMIALSALITATAMWIRDAYHGATQSIRVVGDVQPLNPLTMMSQIILLGLAWASLIMLADFFWGDTAALWLAVAAAFVNAGVVGFFYTRRHI